MSVTRNDQSVADVMDLYEQLFSKDLSGISMERVFDSDSNSYCQVKHTCYR